MIPLAGILIVFAAVIAGYLMESGPWQELLQPAEIVIITGTALGSAMIANPAEQLVKTVRGLRKVFIPSEFTRERYLCLLAVLSTTFHTARRMDARGLEEAVENPDYCSLFPQEARNQVGAEATEFLCDTLRLSTLATISPFSMDEMLDQDLEARKAQGAVPVILLANLADSLPAFGIVAAVLGVILSMGSMREAPATMGMKIASALIGTFTGILLAYGLVTPLSERLAKIQYEESMYFDSIRAGLSSFTKGMPVSIAVECARRAIPDEVRPDFNTAEERLHQAPPRAHARAA